MAESQEEKGPEGEEAKAQEEDRGKKRGAKRKRGSKQEAQEASAEEPPEKRPVRERKSVVRYSAPAPRRVAQPKAPVIEKGPGTKLRDIPNVHFKLSKRRVDDNLNVLHSILFGRKSNAHVLKRNILQFSGFVWTGNEEKERAKVKEKLDKCTKEKLLDFCQLFDIPINKAIIKKEEASTKLLEFLESPRATRDVVLAEKAQHSKKRKRMQTTSGEASSEREIKKQKRSPRSGVKKGQKRSAVAEKEEDRGQSGSEEETDHQKSETKDEEDKREKPVMRKKSSEKPAKVGHSKVKKKASPFKKGSSAESSKSTSKSILKASSTAQGNSKAPVENKKVSFKEPTRKETEAVKKERAAPTKQGSVKISKRNSKSSRTSAFEDDSDSSSPSTSKPIKDDKKISHTEVKPSTKASKKKATTSESKVSTKGKEKRKAHEIGISGPTREEMLPVVSKILMEVDFDVATLADVLRQLEAHFKVDLMDRREEVKDLIEEAVRNMSDVEEDEEDEGNAKDVKGRDDKDDSDGDAEEANPEEGSDGEID